MTSAVDYPRAVALAHVAELLDELLPDREANDAMFRLALSVLGSLRRRDLDAGDVLRSVDDAAGGISAGSSRVRGLRRDAERKSAFFHVLADGLMCVRGQAAGVVGDCQGVAELAAEMFRAPVESFAESGMAAKKAVRICASFLVQIMSGISEKKLVTAGMLERI